MSNIDRRKLMISGAAGVAAAALAACVGAPLMTKPEACASCGALDLAGWVTGRPHSFKQSPSHRGKGVFYLCSSCFTMELAARQRDHTNMRSMELFSR